MNASQTQPDRTLRISRTGWGQHLESPAYFAGMGRLALQRGFWELARSYWLAAEELNERRGTARRSGQAG